MPATVPLKQLDLRRIVQVTADALTYDVVDMARGTFHDLVKENPVREHRMQASWRMAQDAPPDYVEPPGGSHMVPGDEHVDAALGGFKLGHKIYIVDNVPYANRIAHGWSPQAAAGWMMEVLRRNVARVVNARNSKRLAAILGGLLLAATLHAQPTTSIPRLSAFGDRHYKAPVATAADLPPAGNEVTDTIRVQDTGDEYWWNGTAWIDSATQGPSGPTGPQGAKGDKGDTGSAGAAGAAGATGPKGDKGDPGDAGAVGATGSPGSPGADGKTVRNGSGAPSSGLGVDGDFYLDTTAHAIYGPKASGVWGSPTSLIGQTGATGSAGAQGPQGPTGADGAPGAAGAAGSTGAAGANGATWTSGSGAPSNGSGANGDYYLRTATLDVSLKSAGTWSIIANIKGAQGDPGPQGAPGAAGSNGTNGADGLPRQIQDEGAALPVEDALNCVGAGISCADDPGNGRTNLTVNPPATDAAAGTGSLRTLGSGVLQAAAGNDARLSDPRVPAAGSVVNSSVSASAAIDEIKLNLNFATHSNANDPSAGQKAALAGTNGTPSGGNPFVTASDPVNTNARTPLSHAHAAADTTGGVFDAARIPAVDLAHLANTCTGPAKIIQWDGAGAASCIATPSGPATYAGSASAGGPATSSLDGLTSASGTAPLTLTLAAKALTGSLSVTPTNSGGAIALQAATPGIQQTGNLNLSGAGIFGGAVFGSNLSGTNTGDQVIPANTTATASNWFTAYNSATGAFTKARPACADLSNAAASCATDATNASNLASGTVPTARLGSGTPNNTTFLRGDQTWATPAGGSSSAVPTDYPSNLVIWLKASALTGFADGDPVTTWTDSSGNGHNFTQATSGARPVYRTTGMIAPALQFDGVNDCLSATSISLSSFSIFVVFAATNAGIIYEHSSDVNSNNGSILYTGNNNTITVHRTQSSGRDLTVEDKNGTRIPWGADDQWHVVLHEFQGTYRRHRLYVDGAWPLMTNVSSSSPLTGTATDTIFLGCRNNSAAFAAMLIEDFIVFSPALAAADEEKIIAGIRAADSL